MQYNSCFYSSYILQPRAELCPLLKPSGTALSPHLPTPLHSTLSQRHAQKNLVRTFSHLSQSFCNSTWRNVPPQRYPRNTQCILSLIQTMQSVLLSSDHKHLLMSQCLETCKHTHCIFFLSWQVKSCRSPTIRIMLSPVRRWCYWLSTRHKQIWWPNTQKEGEG